MVRSLPHSRALIGPTHGGHLSNFDRYSAFYRSTASLSADTPAYALTAADRGGTVVPRMVTAPLSPREVVERVDELLEASYRSADLGNLEDPLDETVLILLSKQTRDRVYRRVYQELRAALPTWLEVLEASVDQLELLLRPAGFQRQRARQLRGLMRRVADSNIDHDTGPWSSENGDLTLAFLRHYSDEEAEKFLLSLPGIGRKSARCVMAYALERPAFAVDTHVHRIMRRLGVVESRGRKLDHDPFQAAIPPTMRKRLHVNMVHHGRAVCRTTSERCGECVLVSFCERGRGQLANDDPVAVDLFAGVGGLGYGFRQAGVRVGLAVEKERHSAQTYRLNNPGVPVIEAQITSKTRAASMRRHLPPGTWVRYVLAGAPCQGYSAAGSRRPENPTNSLYVHVARLARQLKVEYLVFENVPGVRSVNGHRFLEPIKETFERAGFAIEPHLLRASDYGVPQRRLRYFFLGRRDRRRPPPGGPLPTHRRHGELSGKDQGLPETPTVTEVLGLVPALDSGTEAERILLNGIQYLNMSTMRHSAKVIEKIASIAGGEGPISYRRLDRTEAATLVAGHRALPVHPNLNRTISVREAALLQGFPIDYCFCGPRARQPLQVANAVPPPMAEAVASHLEAAR